MFRLPELHIDGWCKIVKTVWSRSNVNLLRSLKSHSAEQDIWTFVWRASSHQQRSVHWLWTGTTPGATHQNHSSSSKLFLHICFESLTVIKSWWIGFCCPVITSRSQSLIRIQAPKTLPIFLSFLHTCLSWLKWRHPDQGEIFKSRINCGER